MDIAVISIFLGLSLVHLARGGDPSRNDPSFGGVYFPRLFRLSEESAPLVAQGGQRWVVACQSSPIIHRCATHPIVKVWIDISPSTHSIHPPALSSHGLVNARHPNGKDACKRLANIWVITVNFGVAIVLIGAKYRIRTQSPLYHV